MKNLIKGAALLIGGAVIGAAAALLLTPKTGEEVRKEIKDLAEEAKKRAQDVCEQIKQNLSETMSAETQDPETKQEEA